MLHLYIQFDEELGIPMIQNKMHEAIHTTLQDSEQDSQNISELHTKYPIQQLTVQEKLIFINNNITFDIIYENVCCNVLKDFSNSPYQNQLNQFKMVLGIALPPKFDINNFIKEIKHFSQYIDYIRIFRDHDFSSQHTYKELDLIAIVFHKEEYANQFLKEYRCFQPNHEVQEFIYFIPLNKIVYIPYKKTPSFELDENPLDVAQQLALMGDVYLTLLPKCPLCIERIEGSLTGVDFSRQKDIQKIYASTNRWLIQKKNCKVCSLLSDKQRNIEQHCQICQEIQDVWICLICGNLGCGRYKFAHAQGHYLQTNHIFSFELLTGRLWDYNTDNFVHRLMIGNDMEVLNLPDSKVEPQTVAFEKPDQERVEQVILEYCQLFIKQMEEQRAFYMEKVEILKENNENNLKNKNLIQEVQQKSERIVYAQKQRQQIQLKLEEVRRSIKTLQQKQQNLDKDIEEQKIFNLNMKEKIKDNKKQQDFTEDVGLSQIIQKEQNKLVILKDKLQKLYVEFEKD